MRDDADGQAAELNAARETIAGQAAEIERLRRELGAARAGDELRAAFTIASGAVTIDSPASQTELLQMIVETAAGVIAARAGALFLVDVDGQELIFEVATGPKAEEVKRFRVPLGHGIAGLVAVSGQPMAVSDVQRDARHASDIAREVGYLPESILCVPLFYRDEVIGVLELLDKQGGASFTTEDMETLGLFARQAAVAIEQSRIQENLGRLVRHLLVPDGARQESGDQAAQFASALEADESYQQALDLARLVHEIVQGGPLEYRACQAILSGFADYLRARAELMGGLGGAW
jgi:GAF domain-containing protein